jgi:uncharacterized protein DUF5681
MTEKKEIAVSAGNCGKPKGRPRGRPFAKGVSGNPSGRPKVVFNAREYAAQYAQEMIDILVAIARDKTAVLSARTAAASELLDRGLGKATQFIEGNQNVRYEISDKPMTQRNGRGNSASGRRAKARIRLWRPQEGPQYAL